MPGRHAAPAGPSFYRDLFTMLGGILAVGIVVYLGLSAMSTTETPGSTSSTAPSTTGTTAITTTSEARTTSTATSSTTTTTTTAATTTTLALRIPSEIRVRVLNGVGIAGLASDVSAELQALGYRMLEPGNYSPVLAQSRIWYAEGFEGEAFELAAQFPDAQVEQASADLDADADIVVVLGESHEG